MKTRQPDSTAIEKMARLGQRLSQQPNRSPAYYCDVLVNILEDWTKQLNLPKLGEYGVTRSDLDRLLDQTQNRNNPIELTRSEIRTLLETRL